MDPNRASCDQRIVGCHGIVRRLDAFAWLALLGSASGCDPMVRSERAQVQVSSDMQPASTQLFGGPVLERSETCLRFEGIRSNAAEPPEFEDADHDAIVECYDFDLDGPATLSSHCVSFDEPGRVEIGLTRRACSTRGRFGDDRLAFQTLSVQDVAGVFEEAVPLASALAEYELEINAPAEALEGFLPDPGEPLYVLEHPDMRINTRVVSGPQRQLVHVSSPAIAATSLAGAPDFDIPESSLEFDVRAGAGDVFEVALDTPAGRLEVGEVHVVAPSRIASLELAPLQLRVLEGEAEGILLVHAVAITRDAQGRVLRKPRVTWTHLGGDAKLDTPDDGSEPEPSELAEVVEVCEGAAFGEWRSATLEARVEDFVDTIDLRWQCLERDAEGCRCGSGRERVGPAGLLLPLFALARRRQRPAKPATRERRRCSGFVSGARPRASEPKWPVPRAHRLEPERWDATEPPQLRPSCEVQTRSRRDPSEIRTSSCACRHRERSTPGGPACPFRAARTTDFTNSTIAGATMSSAGPSST